MTAVSKHCCERLGPGAMTLRVALLLLAWFALLPQARAHKASDAYLVLRGSASGIELRWDIALRDLDAVVDVDADGDGRITWRELREAQPAIEAYALPRMALEGCPLRVAGRALERRSDGVYAVLQLASDCALPARPRWRYALFADVDTTHRGIVRIERAGMAPAVALLNPSRGGEEPGAPADADAAAPVGTASFVAEGVHHIVTGWDHLLFLLCLIVPAVMRRDAAGRWQPVPRLRDALLPVLVIVTGFTVAHSITLVLAALQLVSLPAWFVEPAIAATIVLAALDNLRPVFGRVPRGAVSFGFGLIHGFGFAGVLAELDLPAGEFAWALLQFNLGLELGQAAIVSAAVVLLFAARAHRAYPRLAIGGGSLAAIALGVVWFVERTADIGLLPA